MTITAPDLETDTAEEFDLDELTALALAADPDTAVDVDAVPDLRFGYASTLPASYLPGSAPGPHKRWMVPVVFVVIALFVFIAAAGFCSTYGDLVFA